MFQIMLFLKIYMYLLVNVYLWVAVENGDVGCIAID